MRTPRLLLILTVVLLIVAGSIVIYVKHHRLLPTPINWRAHVVTIAGNGAPAFIDAVHPTQAGLSDPFGIAIGPDGMIYISDAGESNRICKLTRDGVLVTIAGDHEGFADGTGPQAAFNSPSGLAIDRVGNLYVADTGNNRIRKVTDVGAVSTVAGTGVAGYADGPAASAQFNGPIGVAVDHAGNVYVADTYNDRIRKISVDGHVTTIAGGQPGYADGDSKYALFDTPCGVAVYPDGTLIVADSGNSRLRKITSAGQVTTLSFSLGNNITQDVHRPVGISLTHDGFLYVTEADRGRVIQISPDGNACVVTGDSAESLDTSRFNQPTGMSVDQQNGDLIVADSANYLVRRLTRHESGTQAASNELLPVLTKETLGEKNLPWPLDPQDKPHEVVATVGEVRGTFESNDSRDHLHSGLDVSGAYGEVVRAIRSEKVTNPLPNWGFNTLSEGLRVGVVSYIHMHVGRDKDDRVFNDPRFIQVLTNDGKTARIRVRRGTRFRPGDALGTVNKMYHVHLIVGPSGAEINPLSLSPVGFKDTVVPTIEKDGVWLFDESGAQLKDLDHGRLTVQGRVRIVVDAFDRVDMNSERRRLGLYSLGYQVFRAGDLKPASGFDGPRINILFNRLPRGDDGPKIAYAQESGITVYGSKMTRFLYEITNTVRDGRVSRGFWDTSELPKGDYILRIIVADFSGNTATRDLLIAVK